MKIDNEKTLYIQVGDEVHTIDSHSYRHKVFTAWVSDFLTDKIWLDKEVVKINNELIDGYTIRINVLLHD